VGVGVGGASWDMVEGVCGCGWIGGGWSRRWVGGCAGLWVESCGFWGLGGLFIGDGVGIWPWMKGFRWLIDSGIRIVKELVVEDLRELRHGKCRFHSVMLER